jgi:hypothetical protein
VCLDGLAWFSNRVWRDGSKTGRASPGGPGDPFGHLYRLREIGLVQAYSPFADFVCEFRTEVMCSAGLYMLHLFFCARA